MAQFYTLEEAARVLGLDPEDLKTKAQSREIRAFLDGGSWRFRVADVDELARRRGLGSDPELPISDLEVPAHPTAPVSDDDAGLSEFQLGVAHADLGAMTMNLPRTGSGSDHEMLLHDAALPPGPVTGSSSVIIGMASSGKLPSDSDVRLVPDNTGGASDSDVRLAPSARIKLPSDSDVTISADDTSEHALPEIPKPKGKGSDTAMRKSPMVGSSAEVKAGEPDSDFELSPSSVIDALQPDSGSDFELTALDQSDEFESTPLRSPSDSDVTAAEPRASGVNLSKPSDSGINLHSPTSLNLGMADSIELAPLSSDEIKTQPPAARPKPALSETPPPSARKGEKDIFDDTDFEVDALSSEGDSDDKTMQLEAASDFEIEDSDTGSEVFAIDEEDVDHNASTALGPAMLDDLDEGGASGETSDDATSAWDAEQLDAPVAAAPVGRGAASGGMLAPLGASAEWGGLWVGLLGVTTVFVLLLALVSIDLARNLYDFRQGTAASGLVKALAGIIGG